MFRRLTITDESIGSGGKRILLTGILIRDEDTNKRPQSSLEYHAPAGFPGNGNLVPSCSTSLGRGENTRSSSPDSQRSWHQERGHPSCLTLSQEVLSNFGCDLAIRHLVHGFNRKDMPLESCVLKPLL